MTFGYKIALSLDKIHGSFEDMIKIAQNSVKASVIYTLFLYNVARDTFAAHERFLATKLAMDSYYINKKLWETAEGKYGEDSTSAVVLISGNKSSLGTVLNTNHELYQILGYEKKSVMQQNIANIMPEIIAVHHNRIIHNCFTKAGSSIHSEERLVFPQHCEGYLVPCTLLTRLVPNLENGIHFIGFLNKVQYVDSLRKGESKVPVDETLIFLLDPEWKLHGFNKKFIELLTNDMKRANINKYLETDQKLNLSTIYPHMFSEESLLLMDTEEGWAGEISLGKLMEYFQSAVLDEVDALIDTNHTLADLHVNVKVKEYTHLNGVLKYSICTLWTTDLMIKPILYRAGTEQDENLGHEWELDKAKKLAMMEDDASISQTTSSNRIISSTPS